MKIVSLKKFIETGSFDTLSIGSTREEVIECLGEKYDFYDSGETYIISFGWYEFFFWTDTGRLYGIQNDHLVADCMNHDEMINFRNKKWQLDTWFLKANQHFTFKQVKELLEREKILYTIEPTYTGCDENIIKCLEK